MALVLRLHFTWKITHVGALYPLTVAITVSEQTRNYVGAIGGPVIPAKKLPITPSHGESWAENWIADPELDLWLSAVPNTGLPPSGDPYERYIDVGYGQPPAVHYSLGGFQGADVWRGVQVQMVANDPFRVCHIDYVCQRSMTSSIDYPLTPEILEAGYDRSFLFTDLHDRPVPGTVPLPDRTLEVRDVWLEWVEVGAPTATPYLRMTQRDDGRGVTGHARQYNAENSQQESQRIHGSNTYV